MLQALGPLRAEKINAASTTLQENAPRRQEALKKFSKNARHQLEEARRNERDAADAAKLITHVKPTPCLMYNCLFRPLNELQPLERMF